MSNATEGSVEVLRSCKRVVVHSGNIASWSKLRKRGVLTSTAEVSNIKQLVPSERSELPQLGLLNECFSLKINHS